MGKSIKNKQNPFEKAYKSSILLRKVATALVIFVIPFGIGSLALQNTHQYLIFSLVSIGPCLIAIFFPPFSVWKTVSYILLGYILYLEWWFSSNSK